MQKWHQCNGSLSLKTKKLVFKKLLILLQERVPCHHSGKLLDVYFIQYCAHTSIVRTLILKWFLAEKKNYFNFQECFNQLIFLDTTLHPLDPKPFLNYLSSIALVIFHHYFLWKKCALYSIKYVTLVLRFLVGMFREYPLFCLGLLLIGCQSSWLWYSFLSVSICCENSSKNSSIFTDMWLSCYQVITF